jgi:hypothetical protein
MKLCGWNCRAANSPTAVRSLPDLREHLKHDILFLSESHLNKEDAESLRRKLVYDFMCVVESDGRSRGLVLFWNDENKMVSVSHLIALMWCLKQQMASCGDLEGFTVNPLGRTDTSRGAVYATLAPDHLFPGSLWGILMRFYIRMRRKGVIPGRTV